MALQTKTYTQTSNTFTLELTLVEQSTSTAGNTSTISYTLKLKSTTKNFAQYGVGASVKLDNKTVATRDRGTAPQITLGTYSEVTLLSGSATISHNSDGSKTMPYFFDLDMASASYTPGPMEKSGTMTLTKIPRGATITSAPDFTDEDNPVVKVSNPAGVSVQLGIYKDSTHALAEYRTISGTSYTFNLTTAEREALRKVDTTKNTAQVRFYVKSVVGGQTFISYLTRTLTIKNPAPTLSPTVEDVNPDTVALTGSSSKLVKFKSTAQIAFNAEAVKHATISSKVVDCAGKTLTNDGIIAEVESGTFSFTVKDSRGNTTKKTVELDMVKYVRLTCNLGDEIPDPSGNYNFSAYGDVFTGSFGEVENTITVEARYKEHSSDTWGPWTPMEVTPGMSSYTAALRITGLDYRLQYDFQARATDKLIVTESIVQSLQALPMYYYNDRGFYHRTPLYLVEDIDGETVTRSLERCGITARIASTVSLSGGEKSIPVTSLVCKYGGAEIVDGEVSVKYTGVYEVSGSVYFASTAGTLYCGAYIRSIGKEIAAMHSGIAGGVGGIVVPPTLVELEAGSTIALSAYTSTGASATVNNDPRTKLTVKQVY